MEQDLKTFMTEHPHWNEMPDERWNELMEAYQVMRRDNCIEAISKFEPIELEMLYDVMYDFIANRDQTHTSTPILQ